MAIKAYPSGSGGSISGGGKWVAASETNIEQMLPRGYRNNTLNSGMA
jgi:hypothetical protein